MASCGEAKRGVRDRIGRDPRGGGRRPRSKVAALLVVALLGVTLGLPSTGAAAQEAPVATTTTVQASPRLVGQPVILTAKVRSADAPVAGGIVEFRAGATVLGRAHNRAPGSATLGVTLPAGAHEVTAEFLGTTEAAGSVGMLAFTVNATSVQPLVVEDVATAYGPGTADAGGTAKVLYELGSPDVVIDDPDTGEIRLEREVPGVGTVGLGLRPRFPVNNTTFGWDGIVAVLDLAGNLAVPEPRLGLRVHRLTIDGEVWGTSCPVQFRQITASGQLTGDGYRVAYDARPAPVKATATCDFIQAWLVQQVLGQRFTLDLLVPGSFTGLLGPDDVTRTVVTATPTRAIIGDRVSIAVAVTYGEAPDELPAAGTVRLLQDGVEVQSGPLGTGGLRTFSVLLTTAGSHSFTVAYDGPAAPSSDTVVVDVDPFAVGLAATGTISLETVTSPLPPGAVWSGEAYDPATGMIGPGRLVSPMGVVGLPDIGFVFPGDTAEARFVQLDDATGQVLPDGSVEIGPLPMVIEVRSGPFIGTVVDCFSHPFEVVLRGTADGSGLQVAQVDIPHDGFGTAGCGLLASLGGFAGIPLGLALDIEGDFTPPPA